MKSLFSIIVATILCGITAYGQSVPTVISTTPRVEQTIVPYDSLRNIYTDNCKQLIGQEIYFLPNHLYKKDGDYNLDILTTRPTGPALSSKLMDGSNVYQPYECSYGAIKTSYAGLVQKKFKIIDYIEVDGSIGKPWPFLVLENPLDGSNLYMEANLIHENKTPFIILGYFDKLKQKYIGRDYKPDFSAKLFNLETNTLVRTNIPDPLHCIDLTILDAQWNPVAFVFQDADSTKYYAELENVVGRGHGFRDIAEYRATQQERQQREAEHLRAMIAKYGKTNGTLIAEGRVRVGFTKQMCIDAWGEPQKKNKTTTRYGTSEQWVYSLNSYLYFEGNKLTSIQN